MPQGFIYILSNPAMPGFLKVGMTTNPVPSRAQELSVSTGVPLPFEVEYFCLTEDVEEVEREAHARLDEFRVSERREFFRIEIQAAIELVDECVHPVQTRFQRAVPSEQIPEHEPSPNGESTELESPILNEIPESAQVSDLAEIDPLSPKEPPKPFCTQGFRFRSVSLYCSHCNQPFQVTLVRYEEGAKCPFCGHLSMLDIKW